ncbi:IucA/IucC family protein [Aliikangiella sp. G2MR2-5]|uniref:IucA/IucC family protein n=1 Tax=Aliikangiella sp. G2MR2-5 TaxID=2788943 RepID=UPI0018ABC195|nr:IucA/IucC family protein [Aliikangiella sp. G2MR2-5]
MNDRFWQEVSQQEEYITRRVMDAFLREDIRTIVSHSEVIQKEALESKRLKRYWPLEMPDCWLKVAHLGKFNLFVPLRPCNYMQDWKVQTAAWLFELEGEFYGCNHFSRWLEQFATGLNDEQFEYFCRFDDECHCAVEQKILAQVVFQKQRDKLGRNIFRLANGWQKMLLIEQLAAHCDHPLYPTARAKFGLSADAIEKYCPEAMPEFELNWLAVPRALYHSCVSEMPDIWPSFEQVGLAKELADDYRLVPVHPLTFDQYLKKSLSDWEHHKSVRYAPTTYLKVRPTLSVRTLALVDKPECHIKLPLPMRTLGNKNIRTIKPSTINDGFVFQQLLQYLAVNDKNLQGRYLHCDEESGGHIDQRSDLAWLVRRYPAKTGESTPVCVAALMAETADGSLVIEQLAAEYYQGELDALLDDYFSLLLKVHLRLCLVYGIALESNQQNTMLLFSHTQPLQLLFRDNDAGRINPHQLTQGLEKLLSQHVDPHDSGSVVACLADDWLVRFVDQRIMVEGQLPLLQMFTTINLQLNIGCIIAGLAERGLVDSRQRYACLFEKFNAELTKLESQAFDTSLFKSVVLDAPHHYAKYLLTAASLLSKQQSQAADINKFYGLSAPNPLQRKAG